MGIEVPIIPGLKPLTSKKQLSVIPRTFHVDIPTELSNEILKAKTDDDCKKIGQEMAYATIKRTERIWRACTALLYIRQYKNYLQCSEGSDVIFFRYAIKKERRICASLFLFFNQTLQYRFVYFHRVFLFQLCNPLFFHQQLVIVNHQSFCFFKCALIFCVKQFDNVTERS